MRHTYSIAAIAATLALYTGTALSGPLSLTSVAQLRELEPGQIAVLTGFPVTSEKSATVEFRRIDIYSPEAQVILASPLGQQVLPRSNLLFFLGTSVDGSARVGMSLTPDGSRLSATVRSAAGNFEVASLRQGEPLVLVATPIANRSPTGAPLDFRCGQQDLKSPTPPTAAESSAIAAPQGAIALRKTVIAVETDGEWLNQVSFGGNTTTATNWIAQLMLEMNVLYERDINLQLLLGTTILNANAASDPYAVTGSPASGTHLNEFGNYWSVNRSRVYRHFAMLLSGKSSNQFSASGIAWLNVYCVKAAPGSYSVSQTFTFSGNTPAQNASLIAHELGHNLGSPHTHCDDGDAGNGVTPLDQCFNGEGGCFSGTQACPGGVDNNRGTLMSYCHIGACNPTANAFKLDYTSQPTNPVAARMNSRITANFATCIDRIFVDGMQ